MSYTQKSLFASLPRTTRGLPIVIGGDPKGNTFLYANGNSIIIRDIDNPAISDVYTEHSQQTTVAKYSPSGFYIASGDVSGKIRIWDTTQKEHILKNEFQPFAGTIKDLAWSSDNQRIVAVGEGREKFGHVFNSDTGTSVGEIMGQSKPINSVDFKPTRPYRIVTASEDNTLAFFQGPPFRFQTTLSDHQRFVNAVRYSPTGEVFISAGADGHAFIYDGTSSEKKGELGSPAHKGGLYALSFSEDGAQVMTVSADKTAKIWDVQTSSVVTEFNMGSTIDDMQVGCLWQGPHLLTVSLSGFINYLDKNNPSTPLRIVKGHNKPITAMAITNSGDIIFSGASDGNVCHWDVSMGTNDMVSGKGHTNQVQDMVMVDDTLVSVGMDDAIIFTDANSKTVVDRLKLPSQPKGLAGSGGGLAIVACIGEIVVLRNQNIVYTEKVDWEPQCATIHPGQTQVAVGGGRDNLLHIYELSNDALSEVTTLPKHSGPITDVKYSPDGASLVAVTADRKLVLYKLPDYESPSATGWSLHTARVNTLSWTPDSQNMATGALDTNIIVWNPEKVMKSLTVKGAHPMSQITRIQWIDNDTLVTVGHDSCIKQWNIVRP